LPVVTAREALARSLLAVSGLAHCPDEDGPRPVAPTSWRDPAEGPTPTPRPLVPYLRRLAETRPVVFHGSRHRGLVELSDERRSRDASAYGDQQAVFASQDPVWALWFAVLRRREDGLVSTRNASLGADAGVRERRYLFSVNGTGERFGPGAVYVLPAVGFAHEGRLAGLFDTAHRTHLGRVRPLAWFEVEPDDFPLIDSVIVHREGESMARTLWNVRRPRRSCAL
jgi:hypothetical protein